MTLNEITRVQEYLRLTFTNNNIKNPAAEKAGCANRSVPG